MIKVDEIVESGDYSNLLGDQTFRCKRFLLDIEIDKRFVYRLMENDTIISFAILSYRKGGILEPYDLHKYEGIEWYLEWIQTNEEYERKGYGGQLFEYIKNNVDGIIYFETFIPFICFHVNHGAYLFGRMECFDGEKYNMVVSKDEISFEEFSKHLGHVDTRDIEASYNLTNFVNGKCESLHDVWVDMFEEEYDCCDIKREEVLGLLKKAYNL